MYIAQETLVATQPTISYQLDGHQGQLVNSTSRALLKFYHMTKFVCLLATENVLH